jgi:hypothetical protein
MAALIQVGGQRPALGILRHLVHTSTLTGPCIYEWVQRGALPAEKLGGTIYVPKWALARLLSPATHEQPAPTAVPAGAGGEVA